MVRMGEWRFEVNYHHVSGPGGGFGVYENEGQAIADALNERDDEITRLHARVKELEGAAGGYLSATGACMDSGDGNNPCSLCHDEACGYCALARAMGDRCSEDCPAGRW